VIGDEATERALLRDLGDGLILRRSTAADREAVAEFHANTLLDIGEEPPLERLYYWILDLISGDHPCFDPRDFTIVEDTATGKIVSSMALISQTWTYEAVPFPAGQPDVVSTDPAYRRRGLVRAQMEVIHRWSAARGELVQGITGIPWYYRQFGYEMALSLDASRLAFPANVPRLNEGELEPNAFRPATSDDLPFVMAMYQQEASRSLVAGVRDEALWRYDLMGRHEKSGMRSEFRVIEAREGSGEPVGLLITPRRLWGTRLGVRLCEVKPGVPWLAVTPSVLRHLDAAGQAYAARDGGTYEAICFHLGERHPLYDTVPRRLPEIERPYAWFIRVPDLPAFVRHIAPVLETRLAESIQAGYSGDLAINFFRDGLRLRFDEGAIAVERWMPERIEAGDAAFPDLTFLQLLFGFRALDELEYAFPDCAVATDEARALLPILFPKKSSQVWSGG
jgi:hypothetical protein